VSKTRVPIHSGPLEFVHPALLIAKLLAIASGLD